MKSKKAPKEIAFSTRIDARVKALTDQFCQSRGLVISHFVQEALLDKLEESQDVVSISKLRREPVRLFEDVLKELDLND